MPCVGIGLEGGLEGSQALKAPGVGEAAQGLDAESAEEAEGWEEAVGEEGEALG